MKKTVAIFCLLSNLMVGQTRYQKDFDELWNIVNENYAYLQQQHINWQKVKIIYSPVADTIKTDNQFIRFLETVLNELHNGHTSLMTNLETSNKLVPSGTDMYVEKINNHYYVTDLRKGFDAEQSGLKIGMEVLKFNDKEIDEQLVHFLPKYAEIYDTTMYQFAIDMLFAGTHNQARKISVLENGKQKDFYPDRFKMKENNELIESKLIDKNTGYIKINNSLYDYNLIKGFDNLLDSFMSKPNIIIDLSETPSGGNTTVARSIMGRFTEEKVPYQQHEVDEPEYETKQSWVEYVTPRKTIYHGNLIILVGHWTGSMGEGIAIGFDGMKNATVVGTTMAGLLGAINGFKLTESKIGFQIPTERLYHINGVPREDYRPKIVTKNGYQTWEKIREILKQN
jgi:carboxyl-terminal processing protease